METRRDSCTTAEPAEDWQITEEQYSSDIRLSVTESQDNSYEEAFWNNSTAKDDFIKREKNGDYGKMGVQRWTTSRKEEEGPNRVAMGGV